MNPLLVNLQCSDCSAIYPANQLINLCTCGKPLMAMYDLAGVRKALSPDILKDRPHSMWRYGELLPVKSLDQIISLGEGCTPLLDVKSVANKLGLAKVWVKDEGCNPTGSFKARGLSVAVTMAKLLGAKKLGIPSAGNAGGALAAYAARAGLEANIFMPQDVPITNRVECEAVGANIYLVNGLITDCGQIVGERAKTEGWFDLSTLKEPYRIEGKKTMGFELAEQLKWSLPDVIIYPTGGGTGLVGMWKAFHEMQQLGWIGSKLPKMVSVQSTGCCPIVKAFHSNQSSCEPWLKAVTIAAGLRVPRAIGDFLMLKILRKSGGTAISVEDEEMMREIQEIGQTEGLLLCPEGGASFAALKQLKNSGFLSQKDEVVVFNTGSGIKYGHLFEDTSSDGVNP